MADRTEATLVERIEAAAAAAPGTGRLRARSEAPFRQPLRSEAGPRRAEGEEAADGPPSAPAGSSPPAAAAEAMFELPFAQLAVQGYVTPLAPRGGAAEEMRIVKQGLLGQFQGSGRQRTLLVTSPDRGAGKSFFALNLALSLAMDEQAETVLVDADPHARRPWPIGIDRAPGFADLLRGRPEAQAWRRAAQLPISFLPFGSPVDAPAALFASEAAAAFMRAAAARADWVILDGPPVRKASGAGALAARVGQVALVAGSEATTRRALREALDRLGGGDRVSIVLNGAPSGAAGDWPPMPLE
jgi:Mrp family chromosome partitioning ATPase